MPDHEFGDSIDTVLADWARELPELPVAPVGIITRIGRLRARLDDELASVFARHGLTPPDFAVLAVLRRAGAPFELSQSVLVQRLGLTSGTVSVRLGRLSGSGIVARSPNNDDTRGSLVRLTAAGVALFNRVAPDHLRNEDLLLSALTPPQREQLADLLRLLLASLEHERIDSPLGMILAPAHVARRLRQTVGLPDQAGLLVLEVRPETAAARADLRAGDLITTADAQPLFSCVVFNDLTRQRKPLTLGLERGVDTITVSIGP